MTDLTDQERQMIEIIRENADTTEFRLLIERRDGAWDITMSARGLAGLSPFRPSRPKGEGSARGVGATFDEAWDNMNPLWA